MSDRTELLKRSRYGIGLKSISLVLVASMLFQDLLFANPELKVPALPKPALALKESIGTVQEVWNSPQPPSLIKEGGEGGVVIYLLQDAHTNESAQRNIAAILETLTEKEKIKTVFLEAGTGDDSLSDLRPLAVLEKRKAVADIYLRRAHIQGPDYFDLTGEKEIKLWGVEDKTLYYRGIDLYCSLKAGREGANAWLDKLERAIKTLKSKLFNLALAEFDAAHQAHLKEGLGLVDYLRLLCELSQKSGIDTSFLQNIRILKEVREKESSIDFEKPKDADLERYVDYLGLAKKIKAEGLLEEIAWLEERLYDTLSRTADEAELVRAAKAAETLRRLVNLKASSSDLASIEADPRAFEAEELGGFVNVKIMELERHYEDAVFLDKGYQRSFDDAKAFYALTKERDEIFVKNILSNMDETKETKAAFVSGGFHTENLKKLLKEKNVSYVSIIPRVAQETNQKRYEDLLLNQPQTPVLTEPMVAIKSPVRMMSTLPAMEMTVNGARMAEILKKDLTTVIARSEATRQSKASTPNAFIGDQTGSRAAMFLKDLFVFGHRARIARGQAIWGSMKAGEWPTKVIPKEDTDFFSWGTAWVYEGMALVDVFKDMYAGNRYIRHSYPQEVYIVAAQARDNWFENASYFVLNSAQLELVRSYLLSRPDRFMGKNVPGTFNIGDEAAILPNDYWPAFYAGNTRALQQNREMFPYTARLIANAIRTMAASGRRDFRILHQGSADGRLLNYLQTNLKKEFPKYRFLFFGVDKQAEAIRKATGYSPDEGILIREGLVETGDPFLAEAPDGFDVILDYGLTVGSVVDFEQANAIYQGWSKRLMPGGLVVSIPYATKYVWGDHVPIPADLRTLSFTDPQNIFAQVRPAVVMLLQKEGGMPMTAGELIPSGTKPAGARLSTLNHWTESANLVQSSDGWRWSLRDSAVLEWSRTLGMLALTRGMDRIETPSSDDPLKGITTKKPWLGLGTAHVEILLDDTVANKLGTIEGDSSKMNIHFKIRGESGARLGIVNYLIRREVPYLMVFYLVLQSASNNLFPLQIMYFDQLFTNQIIGPELNTADAILFPVLWYSLALLRVIVVAKVVMILLEGIEPAGITLLKLQLKTLTKDAQKSKVSSQKLAGSLNRVSDIAIKYELNAVAERLRLLAESVLSGKDRSECAEELRRILALFPVAAPDGTQKGARLSDESGDDPGETNFLSGEEERIAQEDRRRAINARSFLYPPRGDALATLRQSGFTADGAVSVEWYLRATLYDLWGTGHTDDQKNRALYQDLIGRLKPDTKFQRFVDGRSSSLGIIAVLVVMISEVILLRWAASRIPESWVLPVSLLSGPIIIGSLWLTQKHSVSGASKVRKDRKGRYFLPDVGEEDNFFTRPRMDFIFGLFYSDIESYKKELIERRFMKIVTDEMATGARLTAARKIQDLLSTEIAPYVSEDTQPITASHRKLGRGGASEVWGLDDGRFVKVQILGVLELLRFNAMINEAKVFIDLEKKNVKGVPVLLRLGVMDKRLWAEYRGLPSGRPLNLVTRELNEDQRLQTLIDVSQIVADVNDAGWAHNDIKRSNVIRADAGEVNVLDMGLATPFGAIHFLDDGTIGNYAPKFLYGPQRNAYTDAYSLAVLIDDMRPKEGELSKELALLSFRVKWRNTLIHRLLHKIGVLPTKPLTTRDVERALKVHQIMLNVPLAETGARLAVTAQKTVIPADPFRYRGHGTLLDESTEIPGLEGYHVSLWARPPTVESAYDISASVYDPQGEAVAYEQSVISIDIHPTEKHAHIRTFYPGFPMKGSPKYREGRGGALLDWVLSHYPEYTFTAKGSVSFQKSVKKLKHLSTLTFLDDRTELSALIREKRESIPENTTLHSMWKMTTVAGKIPPGARLAGGETSRQMRGMVVVLGSAVAFLLAVQGIAVSTFSVDLWDIFLRAQKQPGWASIIAATIASVGTGFLSRIVGTFYSDAGYRGAGFVLKMFAVQLAWRPVFGLVTDEIYWFIEQDVQGGIARTMVSMIGGIGFSAAFDYFEPRILGLQEARRAEARGDVEAARTIRDRIRPSAQINRVADGLMFRLAPVYLQHAIAQNILPREYRPLFIFGVSFINNAVRSYFSYNSRTKVAQAGVFKAASIAAAASMLLLPYPHTAVLMAVGLGSSLYFRRDTTGARLSDEIARSGDRELNKMLLHIQTHLAPKALFLFREMLDYSDRAYDGTRNKATTAQNLRRAFAGVWNLVSRKQIYYAGHPQVRTLMGRVRSEYIPMLETFLRLTEAWPLQGPRLLEAYGLAVHLVRAIDELEHEAPEKFDGGEQFAEIVKVSYKMRGKLSGARLSQAKLLAEGPIQIHQSVPAPKKYEYPNRSYVNGFKYLHGWVIAESARFKRQFSVIRPETLKNISHGKILLQGIGRNMDEILLMVDLFPEMESLSVVDADLENLQWIKAALEARSDAPHKKIVLYHADFSSLPFGDGTFDVAYSTHAYGHEFEQWSDVRGWAKELKRVLGSQAAFLTSAANKKYFSEGFHVVVEKDFLSKRFIALKDIGSAINSVLITHPNEPWLHRMDVGGARLSVAAEWRRVYFREILQEEGVDEEKLTDKFVDDVYEALTLYDPKPNLSLAQKKLNTVFKASELAFKSGVNPKEVAVRWRKLFSPNERMQWLLRRKLDTAVADSLVGMMQDLDLDIEESLGVEEQRHVEILPQHLQGVNDIPLELVDTPLRMLPIAIEPHPEFLPAFYEALFSNLARAFFVQWNADHFRKGTTYPIGTIQELAAREYFGAMGLLRSLKHAKEFGLDEKAFVKRANEALTMLSRGFVRKPGSLNELVVSDDVPSLLNPGWELEKDYQGYMQAIRPAISMHFITSKLSVSNDPAVLQKVIDKIFENPGHLLQHWKYPTPKAVRTPSLRKADPTPVPVASVPTVSEPVAPVPVANEETPAPAAEPEVKPEPAVRAPMLDWHHRALESALKRHFSDPTFKAEQLKEVYRLVVPDDKDGIGSKDRKKRLGTLFRLSNRRGEELYGELKAYLALDPVLMMAKEAKRYAQMISAYRREDDWFKSEPPFSLAQELVRYEYLRNQAGFDTEKAKQLGKYEDHFDREDTQRELSESMNFDFDDYVEAAEKDAELGSKMIKLLDTPYGDDGKAVALTIYVADGEHKARLDDVEELRYTPDLEDPAQDAVYLKVAGGKTFQIQPGGVVTAVEGARLAQTQPERWASLQDVRRRVKMNLRFSQDFYDDIMQMDDAALEQAMRWIHQKLLILEMNPDHSKIFTGRLEGLSELMMGSDFRVPMKLETNARGETTVTLYLYWNKNKSSDGQDRLDRAVMGASRRVLQESDKEDALKIRKLKRLLFNEPSEGMISAWDFNQGARPFFRGLFSTLIQQAESLAALFVPDEHRLTFIERNMHAELPHTPFRLYQGIHDIQRLLLAAHQNKDQAAWLWLGYAKTTDESIRYAINIFEDWQTSRDHLLFLISRELFRPQPHFDAIRRVYGEIAEDELKLRIKETIAQWAVSLPALPSNVGRLRKAIKLLRKTRGKSMPVIVPALHNELDRIEKELAKANLKPVRVERRENKRWKLEPLRVASLTPHPAAVPPAPLVLQRQAKVIPEPTEGQLADIAEIVGEAHFAQIRDIYYLVMSDDSNTNKRIKFEARGVPANHLKALHQKLMPKPEKVTLRTIGSWNEEISVLLRDRHQLDDNEIPIDSFIKNEREQILKAIHEAPEGLPVAVMIADAYDVPLLPIELFTSKKFPVIKIMTFDAEAVRGQLRSLGPDVEQALEAAHILVSADNLTGLSEKVLQEAATIIRENPYAFVREKLGELLMSISADGLLIDKESEFPVLPEEAGLLLSVRTVGFLTEAVPLLIERMIFERYSPEKKLPAELSALRFSSFDKMKAESYAPYLMFALEDMLAMQYSAVDLMGSSNAVIHISAAFNKIMEDGHRCLSWLEALPTSQQEEVFPLDNAVRAEIIDDRPLATYRSMRMIYVRSPEDGSSRRKRNVERFVQSQIDKLNSINSKIASQGTNLGSLSAEVIATLDENMHELLEANQPKTVDAQLLFSKSGLAYLLVGKDGNAVRGIAKRLVAEHDYLWNDSGDVALFKMEEKLIAGPGWFGKPISEIRKYRLDGPAFTNLGRLRAVVLVKNEGEAAEGFALGRQVDWMKMPSDVRDLLEKGDVPEESHTFTYEISLPELGGEDALDRAALAIWPTLMVSDFALFKGSEAGKKTDRQIVRLHAKPAPEPWQLRLLMRTLEDSGYLLLTDNDDHIIEIYHIVSSEDMDQVRAQQLADLLMLEGHYSPEKKLELLDKLSEAIRPEYAPVLDWRMESDEIHFRSLPYGNHARPIDEKMAERTTRRFEEAESHAPDGKPAALFVGSAADLRLVPDSFFLSAKFSEIWVIAPEILSAKKTLSRLSPDVQARLRFYESSPSVLSEETNQKIVELIRDQPNMAAAREIITYQLRNVHAVSQELPKGLDDKEAGTIISYSVLPESVMNTHFIIERMLSRRFMPDQEPPSTIEELSFLPYAGTKPKRYAAAFHHMVETAATAHITALTSIASPEAAVHLIIPVRLLEDKSLISPEEIYKRKLGRSVLVTRASQAKMVSRRKKGVMSPQSAALLGRADAFWTIPIIQYLYDVFPKDDPRHKNSAYFAEDGETVSYHSIILSPRGNPEGARLAGQRTIHTNAELAKMLGVDESELDTFVRKETRRAIRFLMKNGSRFEAAQEAVQEAWADVVTARFGVRKKTPFWKWFFSVSSHKMIDAYKSLHGHTIRSHREFVSDDKLDRFIFMDTGDSGELLEGHADSQLAIQLRLSIVKLYDRSGRAYRRLKTISVMLRSMNKAVRGAKKENLPLSNSVLADMIDVNIRTIARWKTVPVVRDVVVRGSQDYHSTSKPRIVQRHSKNEEIVILKRAIRGLREKKMPVIRENIVHEMGKTWYFLRQMLRNNVRARIVWRKAFSAYASQREKKKNIEPKKERKAAEIRNVLNVLAQMQKDGLKISNPNLKERLGVSPRTVNRIKKEHGIIRRTMKRMERAGARLAGGPIFGHPGGRPSAEKIRGLYELFDNEGNLPGKRFTMSTLSTSTSIQFGLAEVINAFGDGLGILSVGAGRGDFEQALQTMGHQVTGIDLSPKNVQLAAEKGVRASIGDAHDLRFESGTFDVVLFSESIGHMELNVAVEQAFRVLKPGGHIIVTVFQDSDPATMMRHYEHIVYVLYPGRDIQRSMLKTGFVTLQIDRIPQIATGRPYPYLIFTAQKPSGARLADAVEIPNEERAQEDLRVKADTQVKSLSDGFKFRKNWMNAAEVPWNEMVFFAGEMWTENQNVYWYNQIAVRKVFLTYFARYDGTQKPDFEAFKQFLLNMHDVSVIGESGNMLYISPTTEAQYRHRQTQEMIMRNSLGHFSGYSPDRQLKKIFEKFEYVVTHDFADNKEMLQSIYAFYEEAGATHIFETPNHSIVMNMVNAMLRLHGLNGISHGDLDFVRRRPKPEGFNYFIDLVKASNPALPTRGARLAKKDSAKEDEIASIKDELRRIPGEMERVRIQSGNIGTFAPDAASYAVMNGNASVEMGQLIERKTRLEFRLAQLTGENGARLAIKPELITKFAEFGIDVTPEGEISFGRVSMGASAPDWVMDMIRPYDKDKKGHIYTEIADMPRMELVGVEDIMELPRLDRALPFRTSEGVFLGLVRRSTDGKTVPAATKLFGNRYNPATQNPKYTDEHILNELISAQAHGFIGWTPDFYGALIGTKHVTAYAMQLAIKTQDVDGSDIEDLDPEMGDITADIEIDTGLERPTDGMLTRADKYIYNDPANTVMHGSAYHYPRLMSFVTRVNASGARAAERVVTLEHVESFAAFLQEHFKGRADIQVYDFGAGWGDRMSRFGQWLQKSFSVVRIVGFDESPVATALALEKGHDVHTFRIDETSVEDLPKADIITMFLPFPDKLAGILAAAKKTIKPDGLIIIQMSFLDFDDMIDNGDYDDAWEAVRNLRPIQIDGDNWEGSTKKPLVFVYSPQQAEVPELLVRRYGNGVAERAVRELMQSLVENDFKKVMEVWIANSRVYVGESPIDRTEQGLFKAGEDAIAAMRIVADATNVSNETKFTIMESLVQQSFGAALMLKGASDTARLTRLNEGHTKMLQLQTEFGERRTPEGARLTSLFTMTQQKVASFFIGVAMAASPSLVHATVPVKGLGNFDMLRQNNELSVKAQAPENLSVDLRELHFDLSPKAIVERRLAESMNIASGETSSLSEDKVRFDSLNAQVRSELEMAGIPMDTAVVVEFDDSIFDGSAQGKKLFEGEVAAYRDKNAYIIRKSKGEPVPAALAKAPRVFVFAPGSGKARSGVINVSMQPFGDTMPVLPAVFDVATASGRIGEQNIPDGYLNAYSTLTGARLNVSTLLEIRSGRATLEVFKQYSFKPLERVGDVIRSMGARLRQLAQSA